MPARAERTRMFEGRCQVVVSLAAPDVDGLSRALANAGAADLIEARLDALADPIRLDRAALEGLVRRARAPVGFTCRPGWEGGGFNGAEGERKELLQRAAAAGAAFVDVEQDAEWAREFVESSPAPVVLSHHWRSSSTATPDMGARANAMARLRPAVAKLVVPAGAIDDALPVLEVGRELVARGQPTAAFAVGEAGAASRVLAVTYGAALIYAAFSPSDPVAPGQWGVEDLMDTLRIHRWGADTRCCGLVGHPISHSLSPVVFNAAFAAAGSRFGYMPLRSARLDPALRVAERWGFRGLSVTMPFKRQAAKRCVALEPAAAAIGAVNTLVATEDGWEGHNTDAAAVVGALARIKSLDGCPVGLVGAGGAAEAAAAGLERAGARLLVVNRTAARARELADRIGGDAGGIDRLRQARCDVIVNATPVGMAGSGTESETPFPVDWLRGDELVFDMVYRPRRTTLLRGAEAAGCQTIDGLEMFLRQAAAQLRLWTGDDGLLPLAAMKEAAEAVLAQDRAAGDTVGGGEGQTTGRAHDVGS